VVFEYEQPTVGIEAAAFAMRLLRGLLRRRSRPT
jgi:hypothetical protein